MAGKVRRAPSLREQNAIQLGCFLAQPVVFDDESVGIVIEVSATPTSQVYR